MKMKQQPNPVSPLSLWKARHWQVTREDTTWDEWQDDLGVPELSTSYRMDVDLEPFDGAL